jgi:hypothetical protein
MEVEALASVTQFGIAGLVGWMWLVERRAAAAREKIVQEAHDRLIADKTRLEVLVQALRDNTRALTALEVGQRCVAEALRGLRAPAGHCEDGAGAASGEGVG